jgi:hypothetical protein
LTTNFTNSHEWRSPLLRKNSCQFVSIRGPKSAEPGLNANGRKPPIDFAALRPSPLRSDCQPPTAN